MIIVSLGNSDAETVRRECEALRGRKCIPEIRLDYFDDPDFSFLQKLSDEYSVLFTFRSQKEGGKRKVGKKQRRDILEECFRLKPRYIDLEFLRDREEVSLCRRLSPETKVILSFHHPFGMPGSPKSLLRRMKEIKAWKYKIVGRSHNTTEALKMLLFAARDREVIPLAIGEGGEITRILSPLVGRSHTYAFRKNPTAPGQVSLDDLEGIYHYGRLNRKTQLFGVIGDPVSQSPGYLLYNALFERLRMNAVYVSFRIGKEELVPFLTLLKRLPFTGLSVTVPHKERVGALLSSPTKEPINTLKYVRGRIVGCNTDGPGAVEVLEKNISLSGKKIVLIGAGGAAKGLASFLRKKGCSLTYYRRRPSDDSESLDRLIEIRQEDYDVLIQTTPVGSNSSESLVPSRILYPGKIVWDILFQPTKLLSDALEKGCCILTGKDLYLAQGVRQLRFWRGILPKKTETLLEYFYDKIENRHPTLSNCRGD